jgi:hypothetical protein
MKEFWKKTKMSSWTKKQWESLCDGCGKCCMIRLEDEDTGIVHTTNVACKLFDRTNCNCYDYSNRNKNVPDCVTLSPDNVAKLHWMPDTCAYRLIAEGKPLFDWHYLISGDKQSIHLAGMSVQDRSICETSVKFEDLEDHLVNWPGEERRG